MPDFDKVRQQIEGVMGQLVTARELYEAKGVTTTPVDAAIVSLLTMLESAELETVVEADDDGECKHPLNLRERHHVGGGRYYIMCTGCNEMIEQG